MINAEYIDHMGSDLTVVNSARVSFNKESKLNDQGMVTVADEKLIRYLAKHGHFTPFTHPQITLRETVPIFLARQRFKHQIGFTYNEVSRRYVDDTPEFYEPHTWRKRPEGSVKQGSGDAHPDSAEVVLLNRHLHNHARNVYAHMIAKGVAPEQARMVLPQSMLTSYYVTGSLAAFARAYALRIDPHAQIEIQWQADLWASIIKPRFPVSWAALTQHVAGSNA